MGESLSSRTEFAQAGTIRLTVRAVFTARLAEVLRLARAAVRPGGTVLVVDERAAGSFTAPGDGIERFFAADSAIWCLQQGQAGPGPETAGTLIRPAAILGLARRAGYAGGQILPIEDSVWRFCGLVR